MEKVLSQRLGGDGHGAGFGSADARDALLVGRMLAVRLRDDQHAHRAMLLRVQDFYSPGAVTRVAGTVEDGAGIGLLRLVVENHDDFSMRVDALVVVVI